LIIIKRTCIGVFFKYKPVKLIENPYISAKIFKIVTNAHTTKCLFRVIIILEKYFFF